ncbi:MAG: HAD-superfamily hydrolase, subfamily variant 1 [Proteobacteria bacterium]|nr:HAD-superfamily hydrolase, subfamily variant 1 [Pseudomonadota bacterium]
MRNRYHLLVFDWDGTLFDSIGWIVESIQRAAAICQCRVPSDEAARSVIGLSLDGAMSELFPAATGPTTTRLVEEYRRIYLARKFGEDDLFPQVREMLQTLQDSGYKLAVATGKTRGGLIEAMGATGTRRFFDAVRSADETASKPHPEMLLQLMGELEVAPERTLMVGDSLHDLRMARNAGVDAVAVSCGANSRQQLCELEPLLCLEQTAALLPLLV